jgi:hypothetical protein
VRRGLEVGLRAKIRGLNTLLELLLELSIESGCRVEDQGCREYLEGFSGSSKTAKAAKRLLALEETDRAADSRRAAGLLALQGQLALREDDAHRG